MVIADLSQNASKSRTPQPEPAAEDQSEQGEYGVPSTINVLTAFMIVITPEGEVGVIADINAPVVPLRAPTGDEIYGALHTAAHKLSAGSVASMAANEVMAGMQRAGQQMAEAQANARVQAKLPAGFKR